MNLNTAKFHRDEVADSRMFRRSDIPAALAVVVLIALMLAAASARAQDLPAPVQAVAQEIAKEAASSVAAPGWLSLAGNLTVAGILWYYSRRFYDDKKDLDKELLNLTRQFATLAAQCESALREFRSEIHNANASSQRIVPH